MLFECSLNKFFLLPQNPLWFLVPFKDLLKFPLIKAASSFVLHNPWGLWSIVTSGVCIGMYLIMPMHLKSSNNNYVIATYKKISCKKPTSTDLSNGNHMQSDCLSPYTCYISSTLLNDMPLWAKPTSASTLEGQKSYLLCKSPGWWFCSGGHAKFFVWEHCPRASCRYVPATYKKSSCKKHTFTDLSDDNRYAIGRGVERTFKMEGHGQLSRG